MDKYSALTTLVCVVEQNSFSRAAEQLGKTPSAVAKTIAALEAELGARLFERSTRRIQLTEAGRLYAQAAREALACLGQASEAIGQLQHELHGELRIAAPLAYGPAFLGAACAGFALAHPQLRLQVDLSDNDQAILDGGYDLILNEGNFDIPGLIARTLGRNDLLLSTSPAYLARQPLPVNRETLLQHDWLMYQHPALSRHYWTFRHHGEQYRIEQPQPRLRSDNYDLLLANALAGVGLLITPRWSAAPYLADGRLVRLLPDWELDPDAFGPHILALYPSHRRAVHKVQVFIHYLEQYLREQHLA